MGLWYGLLLCFFCVPLALGFTIILPDSPDDLLNTNTDKANTDPEEQKAVYEIMNATGNGWATSIPDVCKGRWHGIECMPDQSDVLHVVSLSFGALSDDTAFPTCDTDSFISPAISRLPHLKRLFFYQCCKGNPQPIPKALGLLSNSLESLVLRENGHVGSVPPELGNLTRLHTLDLFGNNLNSVIPTTLSNLTHLQLLDLSNNKLVGGIPSLEPLTSLNILDLHLNLLSGTVQASIGHLNSLVKLDLSRNNLSGSVPTSIGHLKSLILLDLGHNRLSGQLPDSLGDLKFLQALILQGNSISGPIPEAFGSLEDLTVMALSSAGLEGGIPESLGKLTKLRVLYLDENKLSGTIPTSLAKLAHISELKVNGNLLSGPVPFSRQFIWKMGRRLQLGDNSGLCYQSSNPGEEMDTSFLMGIKHCELKTTGHEVSAEAVAPTSSQLPVISSLYSAKDYEASFAHIRSFYWPSIATILVVLAANMLLLPY